MNMHLTPTDTPTDLPLKPTRETYDRLQQAYEHFNKTLFGSELPNAMITLRRRRGSFGFFSHAQFSNHEGQAADEIALNPTGFSERPLIDMLATLVHEMVHLWQHHHGNPGRGRYHNREWAAKMKSIGLQPTDSRSEDGADISKEIGETITQVIVAGGAFEASASKLLARNFALVWKEAPPPKQDDTAGEAGQSASKSGKRVRYCCPDCDLKAWAKHDAKLVCGDHMAMMLPISE